MHRRRAGRGRPLRGHPLTDTYVVRAARPGEAALLAGIERAALDRFRAIGRSAEADAFAADTMPLAFAEQCIAAGGLFVVARGDALAGFAAADTRDGYVHLAEVDVHPDHAGHGLGARLIDAVTAWGAAQGCAGVTLSTFTDIPWNRPYYARLGFRDFPRALWGHAHWRTWLAQEEEGALDMTRRCMMARDLPDAALPPVCILARALWTAMQAREWHAARALLDDRFTAVWPATREVIRGADAFIALNRTYPGPWRIDVQHVWPLPQARAGTFVRVDNGDAAALATSTFSLMGSKLGGVTELWADAAEPPYDRSRFAHRY